MDALALSQPLLSPDHHLGLWLCLCGRYTVVAYNIRTVMTLMCVFPSPPLCFVETIKLSYNLITNPPIELDLQGCGARLTFRFLGSGSSYHTPQCPTCRLHYASAPPHHHARPTPQSQVPVASVASSIINGDVSTPPE